jgi:hypothetical protein
MSFTEDLASYTAPELVIILGCPRATAYQWKDGRREPPEWQQPHWLAIITAGAKKIKKHNKASLPTMNRPKSSRKGGRKSS